MKKLLCLIVLNAFVFTTYSQVLFSYGAHSVKADEFLYAYNKNKTAASDSAKSLRDYLDLFIKFKLKVQAARDMHLDTLPSLIAELQNFRNQVQDIYLKDEKEVNRLLDEAFKRSQKDIHAIYYFVPLDEKNDTAYALKAIKEVKSLLKNDSEKDTQILADINRKYKTVQSGDLGFITVFSLPYDFENMVYGLKPGQSSEPFRTKKGWYLFKNEGERSAVGKITVAQILLAIPPGSGVLKEIAKKLADSIYVVLINGGDFGALARQFSDDRNTFMNGGIMPEFGTAKYDSVFENHAFALHKDGEISQPFETQFGYHIIRRITAAPIPGEKNETFIYNLNQEVLNDNRIDKAKQLFVTSILPKIGFKRNEINEQDLWKLSDSSMLANKNIILNGLSENSTLFTYNDNTKTTARDWILYLRNSDKDKQAKKDESYKILFADFVSASAVSNYSSRLQNFNATFKSQVQEFEEGSLLFEAMQREVWEKASLDRAGLFSFYNRYKQKYLWDASAEAIIFSCANRIVADNGIAQLKKRKSWKDIVGQNPAQIQADSGRYELGQIPVVDRTNFTTGLITMPVINKNDGTAVFSKIVTVYPPNQQRSFEDAKGLVINDYQNYLEQKWLRELEKKYPIKVHQKVLESLLHSLRG
ncbi:MAG: peptidylprolyl isomerase [Ginsengibacter sp.]